MKLYEYEAKAILKEEGIRIPKGMLVDSGTDYNTLLQEFVKKNNSTVLKAQTLTGYRKKKGLIVFAKGFLEAEKSASKLFSMSNKSFSSILLEEELPIEKEYFASMTYDTWLRKPVLLFSSEGGIDVEEHKIFRIPLSLIMPFEKAHARKALLDAGIREESMDEAAELLVRLYKVFIDFDCKTLEVNPLILTKENVLVAGDAKMVVDDNALFRQPRIKELGPRAGLRHFTKKELLARELDASSHRGVAGKTFIELDGNIAVLASGGGASLTCMDALIEAGGKPANYAEYSGNPPREKVRKLTEIALSRKDLCGCWVVGGTANFTDIFETLSGFIEGLRSIKPTPDYPIVIRRAGPRANEAFEMLRKVKKEDSFDLHFYGEEKPMTQTAKIMVKLALKYERKKK